MSTKTKAKPTIEAAAHPLAIRFPNEQRRKISAAAKRLGLSETDTIRQSVKLGLSVLEKALAA